MFSNDTDANVCTAFQVWSGHLGKPVASLGQEEDGPAMTVSIHPGGESVAVGYHSGVVRAYDIMSGE